MSAWTSGVLDRGTVYIVRGERECVAVSMDIRCGR